MVANRGALPVEARPGRSRVLVGGVLCRCGGRSDVAGGAASIDPVSEDCRAPGRARVRAQESWRSLSSEVGSLSPQCLARDRPVSRRAYSLSGVALSASRSRQARSVRQVRPSKASDGCHPAGARRACGRRARGACAPSQGATESAWRRSRRWTSRSASSWSTRRSCTVSDARQAGVRASRTRRCERRGDHAEHGQVAVGERASVRSDRTRAGRRASLPLRNPRTTPSATPHAPAASRACSRVGGSGARCRDGSGPSHTWGSSVRRDVGGSDTTCHDAPGRVGERARRSRRLGISATISSRTSALGSGSARCRLQRHEGSQRRTARVRSARVSGTASSLRQSHGSRRGIVVRISRLAGPTRRVWDPRRRRGAGGWSRSGRGSWMMPWHTMQTIQVGVGPVSFEDLVHGRPRRRARHADRRGARRDRPGPRGHRDARRGRDADLRREHRLRRPRHPPHPHRDARPAPALAGPLARRRLGARGRARGRARR